MNSPLASDFIEEFEFVCDVMEEFIDNWAVVINEIPDICSDMQLQDLDDLTDRLYGCFKELLGEIGDEEEEQDNQGD